MLIPIPVVASHTFTARGEVWKFVACGHCKGPFAYRMNLEATGQHTDLLLLDLDPAGSAELARKKAEETLAKQAENRVLPIPCPHCGAYQDDMIPWLREEQPIDRFEVAGGLVTLLAFVPLFFAFDLNWLVTALVAPLGLALLACGYVRESEYDPNAGDPEPRKRLGRRRAVWGQAYNDLLREARSPAAARPRTPEEIAAEVVRMFFNPDGTPRTGSSGPGGPGV